MYSARLVLTEKFAVAAHAEAVIYRRIFLRVISEILRRGAKAEFGYRVAAEKLARNGYRLGGKGFVVVYRRISLAYVNIYRYTEVVADLCGLFRPCLVLRH